MSKNFLTTAYDKLRRMVKGIDADALGDAFVQLWCADYQLKSGDEGERLLYSSMRRRQISLWRASARHRTTSLSGLQIAEPQPDNDSEETYRDVWNLIETQLSPLAKDILERHDIKGETYTDIALSLGMSEVAVRMQLSRARRKIRETYRKLKDRDEEQ